MRLIGRSPRKWPTPDRPPHSIRWSSATSPPSQTVFGHLHFFVLMSLGLRLGGRRRRSSRCRRCWCNSAKLHLGCDGGGCVDIENHPVADSCSSPSGVFGRIVNSTDELDTSCGETYEVPIRNGMLELTLPLKEGAKPRRIEVQAAPETREVKQLHAA